METKANYTIVGFFTVLVIAAAFGFVYWMAEYGRGGPMTELIVRIPGSANGLSVGSPVRFNGIQIGSVQTLSIDADDPQYSLAFTQVRTDAPIYPSTKAALEIQGLTGAAYIELSGGRKGEESILQHVNSLVHWEEREIHLRDHMIGFFSQEVGRFLKSVNPAWDVRRVEAPALMPLVMVSSAYSNVDIWVQEQLSAGDTALVLRPETTPSTYAYMQYILGNHSKTRLPLCVWQAGRSYRREQEQATKHIRLKEFWQLEFQCAFTTDSGNDYHAACLEPVRRMVDRRSSMRSLPRSRVSPRLAVRPSMAPVRVVARLSSVSARLAARLSIAWVRFAALPSSVAVIRRLASSLSALIREMPSASTPESWPLAASTLSATPPTPLLMRVSIAARPDSTRDPVSSKRPVRLSTD